MNEEGQTRVLLIGARGKVGRALASEAPAGWTLTQADRTTLDITRREAVLRYIRQLRPQWIINAAAYTGVDAAEQHPEVAFQTNRDGVGYVAEAADLGGARVIHLSTDYVFSGDTSRPYRPCDQPEPLGVYGKSKLAGEIIMAETLGNRCVILRTSAVHGPDGVNFVTTMLRLMNERDHVSVVTDNVIAPTSVATLAAAVIGMVHNREMSGIHHFTDAGLASWYDFAVAIGKEGVARGLLRHCPDVRPVPAKALPDRAPRPRYSLLDSSKTWMELGNVAPHWRAGLRLTLDGIKAKGPGPIEATSSEVPGTHRGSGV